MTNLKHILEDEGKDLVGTIKYTIVDRGHWKIGIIGIAEPEWIDAIGTIDKDDLVYEEMIGCSRHWGQILSKNFSNFSA